MSKLGEIEITMNMDRSETTFSIGISKIFEKYIADSFIEILMPNNENLAIFIVDDGPLPKFTAEKENSVQRFFGFGKDLFREYKYLRNKFGLSNPIDLCFRLMEAIIDNPEMCKKTNIVVKKKSDLNPNVPSTSSRKSPKMDIITPHFGNENFLQSCIQSTKNSTKQSVRHLIGVDDVLKSNTVIEQIKNTQHAIWQISDPPQGAYAVRNFLVGKSRGPFIGFLDSDDLATANRYESIGEFFIDNSLVDCVGSNELQVDYFSSSLTPIKFPKDVNQSFDLSGRPRHAILFGSIFLKSSILTNPGVFYEKRPFGMDSQFIARISFLNTIRNINEYLYIRRVHQSSITQSKNYGMRTPRRERHTRMLNWAYRRVANGRTPLAKSPLSWYSTSQTGAIELTPNRSGAKNVE